MSNVAVNGAYKVINLTSDGITKDTVSFGVFGPNHFQLNTDLVVKEKGDFPRVTLNVEGLGVLSINCEKP